MARFRSEPQVRHPAAKGLAKAGASALLVLGAIFGSIALLGSCAGDRPTLGAIAPTSAPPAGSATTTSAPAGLPTDVATTAPTTALPPSGPRLLGPDDLLGWIATPQGAPEVYASPATDAERLDIPARTSAGAPTTFALIGDAADGATLPVPGWYEVALPTRPNGSTGWVPATSITRARTPFRLFVDLAGRSLRVEQDGVQVLETTVAIGTTENPTPTNGTYVTELIANVEPDGAYGPFAFGLAMHSDTLTEFAGGPGQVGIHGTNSPGTIGDAVSSGCIRLDNEDIQALRELELPLGVPVFIT